MQQLYWNRPTTFACSVVGVAGAALLVFACSVGALLFSILVAALGFLMVLAIAWTVIAAVFLGLPQAAVAFGVCMAIYVLMIVAQFIALTLKEAMIDRPQQMREAAVRAASRDAKFLEW